VVRQEAVLSAHAAALLAATWGAAAAEVNDTSGLDPSSLSARDRERVKDKFRLFNEALEALSARLPHWSVPDAALRRQLRAQLRAAVLPGYAQLYSGFAGSSFTKFKEKYVKYAPDEAERAFQSFFEGLRE
jgi:exocyst complex protein 7